MKKLSKFLLSPVKHIIGLGYGSCKCCGFHWNMVVPHSINVADGVGCFATCEDCWKNKSDEEIISAYNKMYDSWLLGDSHNEPLTAEQIGFTREQMLSTLKKELLQKKYKIMTQEEKQLLIKDISARLPYGVIVDYKEGEYDFHKWKIKTLYAPVYSESGLLIETNCDGWIGYTEYKGCGISSASRALHLDKNLPYLRPMSSMTEEEKADYHFYCETVWDSAEESYYHYDTPKSIDWLNAHHFDYRGLISMGLALEAPEDMYNLNEK